MIRGFNSMTSPVLARVFFALTLTLSIGAMAQTKKAPMTNDNVVQMVASGLTEDVIVGAISANDVDFDVSADGLLDLKKAGVSDRVVQSMIAAEAKKRDATSQRSASPFETQPRQEMHMANPRMGAMGVPILNSPASEAPAQLPVVTLIVGDKKQPMQASLTETANSKGKGGSKAGSVFKGFGKGMAMTANMGGVPVPHGGGGGMRMPGVAYTWALPGKQSNFTISTATPKFEIEFGDIPGVDPDAYEPVLVKLIQTKDNWRLVSSSKEKFDKHGNDTRSDKPEDKVALIVTTLGRGQVTAVPATGLVPGEYGLVLHPKKALKEFAGVPNTNADAIFFSVWDFSLPPAPAPRDMLAGGNRATKKR